MQRVNINGETKINKLSFDNNKVISRDTNNMQTGIIGLDFNSLYPSVFSSTKYEKYTISWRHYVYTKFISNNDY